MIKIKSYQAHPISPFSLIKTFLRNKQLIIRTTKREVVGRYKGSLIGIAWSFFNPIFMLAVYTLVFSMIFKARWGVDGDESKSQFAMILFVGLIVLNLFSEVMNRAPALILSNINYVKKVVYPIEILTIISMGTALFHTFVSMIVLAISFLVFNGHLYWTIVYAPIILFPLILLTLGLSWMLASLGVFIRDVGQSVALLTTTLMFLSPVFYPLSAVPLKLQQVILANPLTFIIEQLRMVIIWGHTPSWLGLSIYTSIACFIMWLGYAWFQKTRKGFADVL